MTELQTAYIFLMIPAAFCLAFFSEGVHRLIREDKQGYLYLLSGIFFALGMIVSLALLIM